MIVEIIEAYNYAVNAPKSLVYTLLGIVCVIVVLHLYYGQSSSHFKGASAVEISVPCEQVISSPDGVQILFKGFNVCVQNDAITFQRKVDQAKGIYFFKQNVNGLGKLVAVNIFLNMEDLIFEFSFVNTTLSYVYSPNGEVKPYAV